MDGELLRQLYHELFHRANLKANPRCEFDHAVILWIHFIAVLHDRSHRWAYDARHWPLWARRIKRPSYSQLMRRLKSQAIQEQVDLLNLRFRNRLPNDPDKAVDGKPLVVGAYSKDRDAKIGRLSNKLWGRGYKLHAIIDKQGAIDGFKVTALNVGEATIARELVADLDLDGALLRADSNYDSSKLYQAVADGGGRLIAPRRKPGTGLGHRKHHPDRLRAIEEFEKTPDRGRPHKRHRLRIEQAFGHLTNLSFGVSPLPNWVRRQHRVERWITAKIVIYHLFLANRYQSKKAA